MFFFFFFPPDIRETEVARQIQFYYTPNGPASRWIAPFIPLVMFAAPDHPIARPDSRRFLGASIGTRPVL